MKVKRIKENEYIEIGGNVFQYLIIDGKHKLVPTPIKKVLKLKKEFTPPTLDEVKAYFKEEGYREDVAERAFKHYSKGDWHDANGKKVNNWKQKMSTNWMKDENKIITPVLNQPTEGIKFFQ